MRKGWFVVLGLAASIWLLGCSDDDSKKKDSCEPSCKDNVLTTCQEDGTPKTEKCTPGCNADGKTCKTVPTCVPSCKDNVLTTCQEDGTPKTEPCTPGCNTDGRTCKQACVPFCINHLVTTCLEDGTSKTEQCEPGCNDDGKTCKEDDRIDKDILPVPQTQDSTEEALCDRATFVEHCQEGAAVYCAESYGGRYQVSYHYCENDTVCLTTLEMRSDGVNVNYATCVEPCDQDAGTTRKECDIDDYDSSEVLVSYTCSNSTVGKVWYSQVAYCAGICSNNSCDESDKACQGSGESKCGDNDNIYACVGGIVHNTYCPHVVEGTTCGEEDGHVMCGSF